MKGLKFLTICFAVCCLFSSSAFAVCGPKLDDDSFPSEGIYVVGDAIEYVIELSIPDDPIYCDLVNFRAFFLNPTTFGTEACEHPDALELPVDSPFVHGSVAYFDSSIIPALSYVIQESDLVEINGLPGKYIVANVCASWLPDSDSKTLYNRVVEPCVQVTKEACGWSKEGDVITYDITITNCGDCTISLYDAAGALVGSVEDSILGDLTSAAIDADGATLAPDQSCMFSYEYPVTAADQPGPIQNEITATYATCIDEPGIDILFVDDSDTAEVNLIHPDFTVDVQCRGVEDGVGNFVVVFTNIGDVALNIQSDLGDFQLVSGQPVEIPVTADLQGECGGGIAELTVNATGTIPPEYCELPNVLTRSDSDTCVFETNPGFTVEKRCLTNPVMVGANAAFEIVVTNTGDVDLYFMINDPAAGIMDMLVGPIAAGSQYKDQVDVPAECIDGLVSNTVTVAGYCGDETFVDEKTATAECTCGGDEGCTPGFWKNHPDCWCDMYAPDMLVSDVWTALNDPVYDGFDGDTLMDALNYGGGKGLDGKVRNLLRHATAALLNACNSNVNYPLNQEAIINAGNAALATKDAGVIQELHMLLAGFNEDSPCPIDAHCRVIEEMDGEY